MTGKIIAVHPSPRVKNNKMGRRYWVEYDLAYDGGGSRWTGYYKWLWIARIAMFYNVRIGSWGGSAKLLDTAR